MIKRVKGGLLLTVANIIRDVTLLGLQSEELAVKMTITATATAGLGDGG